jgi:5-methylcytosine-specific restriction endonuclease McrA
MTRGCVELSYDLAALRELIRPKLNVGCRWCFATITPRNMSIDHQMPICRGGSYSIENCRVICMDCNTTKSIMNDDERELLQDALLLMPGVRVVKRGIRR